VELIVNRNSRGTHMELFNKEEDRFAVWANIAQEKDRLRNENIRMISNLNTLLQRKKRFVSEREFVEYKHDEYGDPDRINELFVLWSGEYENARAEAETLRVQYESARRDLEAIPRARDNINDYIISLKHAISLVTYEIEQIHNAFPDLEERARESEEIFSRYDAIRRDLEENTKVLADLRDKFETASDERREVEKGLLEKKEELATLLKAEDSLTRELTEITDRFNKQQELTEEMHLLKEAIAHLEKSVGEWKDKLEKHEIKSTEMNEQIKSLKAESAELTSELRECEAMLEPFKGLRVRLEDNEKELSLTDEQIKKLTDEIDKITKENEMLSPKATQFEMVKKKLESIK
jgi:chromosome segregation ATPase